MVNAHSRAEADKPEFEPFTTLHGVKILDTPHLRPGMRERIEVARYEGPEIEASMEHIPQGARIVEFGAGVGIVGAVATKNCKASALLSFEPNHRLIPSIEALYRANRMLSKTEVRNALVLSEPDAPTSVNFVLRSNFLGSGLQAKGHPDRIENVQVPVERWEDVKSSFKPTAILMDIEGAEREFFRHADLTGIDTIILETHRKLYARAGMMEIKRSIFNQGFEQVYHLKGVKAFKRV